MSDEPTAEEVRKVRQWECRSGHSWDVISAWGDGPKQLVCSNCGKSYTVVPNDEARAFWDTVRGVDPPAEGGDLH